MMWRARMQTRRRPSNCPWESSCSKRAGAQRAHRRLPGTAVQRWRRRQHPSRPRLPSHGRVPPRELGVRLCGPCRSSRPHCGMSRALQARRVCSSYLTRAQSAARSRSTTIDHLPKRNRAPHATSLAFVPRGTVIAGHAKRKAAPALCTVIQGLPARHAHRYGSTFSARLGRRDTTRAAAVVCWAGGIVVPGMVHATHAAVPPSAEAQWATTRWTRRPISGAHNA